MDRISGFFLVVMLFVFPGCGSNVDKAHENDRARNVSENAGKVAVNQLNQKKNDTPAYKVTFIELGSVRCIPCQKMQPIMKSIEEKYGDQVKVVFHDVWTEEGRPYADQYAIQVIPTQVFLNEKGEEFYRHQGFFAEEELTKVLISQGVK